MRLDLSCDSLKNVQAATRHWLNRYNFSIWMGSGRTTRASMQVDLQGNVCVQITRYNCDHQGVIYYPHGIP